jgi:hypothetical protein
MKWISTVTTTANCDILVRKSFADIVEIGVVGKYEREYCYPIGI